MIEKHYSPRARLVIVSGEADLETALKGELARGRKVGLLVTGAEGFSGIEEIASARGRDGDVEIVRMPADAAGYAREVFTALHALDDSGRDVILATELPGDGAWAGVRDRLARASHRA